MASFALKHIPLIRIFSTGSRDDAELELIADRLQQYDLIAIQEARDPLRS